MDPPRFIYNKSGDSQAPGFRYYQRTMPCHLSRICIIALRLVCSRHHSQFPAAQLAQSAEQAKHTKACPSGPGFDVYRPFRATASHLSHKETQSTNTDISPIGSSISEAEPPDLTLPSTPTQKRPRHCMVVFRSPHACFPTPVLLSRPGDATRMHSVPNTPFQAPVIGEEKMRRIQERISGSCHFGDFPRSGRLLVPHWNAHRTKPCAVLLNGRAAI